MEEELTKIIFAHIKFEVATVILSYIIKNSGVELKQWVKYGRYIWKEVISPYTWFKAISLDENFRQGGSWTIKEPVRHQETSADEWYMMVFWKLEKEI